MQSTEESVYKRIFESIRLNCQETVQPGDDLRGRMAQLGIKKDYDEVIVRVRSPSNSDQAELLEALKYAEEMAQYGMDTSMIDPSKRTAQQNIRAFIVHLHTKTFKSLAEQLSTTERAFRKAMEGQASSFTHQGQALERNILSISKSLIGIANKISNSLYSIHKTQAIKSAIAQQSIQSSSHPDRQAFAVLQHELEQCKNQRMDLQARILQLEKEKSDLLKANQCLLLDEYALNQSFERVIKKEERNHSQIQQFKQKIKEILSLYESQRSKWKAEIAHLKQISQQFSNHNVQHEGREDIGKEEKMQS